MLKMISALANYQRCDGKIRGESVENSEIPCAINCSKLSDPVRRRTLLDAASAMIQTEHELIISKYDDETKLSLYLAESRSAAGRVTQPTKVGIVFAMWNEVDRLMPASSTNPHGEDCLRAKIEALEWLFTGTKISWHVYAVDDGCPRGSYDMARRILEEDPSRKSQVTLMRLANELPRSLPPLNRLESVSGSCKGGSIILGAQQAIADGCDVVVYTDADGSTHLGQIGTFVSSVVEDGYAACLGNRYAPDATMLHIGGRRSRVMKHIFYALGRNAVTFPDYPSPLKAFRASALAAVLNKVETFDFMFDYDILFWLSRMDMAVSSRGYFYVHSSEHSTWSAHSIAGIWHRQLHGLIRLLRLHGYELDAELAAFVESKFEHVRSVETALALIPPRRLSDLDDSFIGDLQAYTLVELSRWLEGNG
ncbi:hypothetical protein MO327_18710 [Xanthomonas translucens]|uniref:hypothetical protein n=1 Tax=Xanthomonas campestris pv. translucens TaxID=343 RepID=UPI00272B47F2|nr:hypothetical protein [Xanthomonas translucens]WLA12153.1 hypothetical protein MO327_18710 [Xanthomonas translucens]